VVQVHGEGRKEKLMVFESKEPSKDGSMDVPKDGSMDGRKNDIPKDGMGNRFARAIDESRGPSHGHRGVAHAWGKWGSNPAGLTDVRREACPKGYPGIRTAGQASPVFRPGAAQGKSARDVRESV
jgi:hypothetical protein